MPFADNRMKYDYNKHQYVLTEEHVLESMNIDLRAILNASMSADMANVVDRLLDRVSFEVYSFIYRVSAFRYATEKILALDDGARIVILEALEEQLLYILQNGDLAAMSGVNVQTGLAMDKSTKRAAEIAPLAEDVLISSGYVRATIPRGMRDIIPHYEEEGY